MTSNPGWRGVGSTPNFLTLTMIVSCSHCAGPIPVNGPTRNVHCSRCQNTTQLSTITNELVLASRQGGAQFSINIAELLTSRRAGEGKFRSEVFSECAPQCSACKMLVPIVDYLGYVGATTTIPCPSCGVGMPTFPAPDWLRLELPTVLQVFGGEGELAGGEGSSLLVNQSKVQPIAMNCPSCSGGLTIDQHHQRTTPCTYCGANIFLPDELWLRLHPVKIMERWTLTFAGNWLETATEIKIADEERVNETNRARARGAKKELEATWAREADVFAAQRRAKEERTKKTQKLAVRIASSLFVLAMGWLMYFLYDTVKPADYTVADKEKYAEDRRKRIARKKRVAHAKKMAESKVEVNHKDNPEMNGMAFVQSELKKLKKKGCRKILTVPNVHHGEITASGNNYKGRFCQVTVVQTGVDKNILTPVLVSPLNESMQTPEPATSLRIVACAQTDGEQRLTITPATSDYYTIGTILCSQRAVKRLSK